MQNAGVLAIAMLGIGCTGTTRELGENPDEAQGSIVCWGDEFPSSDEPPLGSTSPPAGTFADVAVNYYHGCALTPDAEAVCWGRDDIDRMPPAGPFVKIAVGVYGSCGLHPDGMLECWPPTSLAGTFLDVDGGEAGNCGIDSSGALACDEDVYVGIPSPSGTFTQLAVGYMHACALRSDGTLACWGKADVGGTEPPAGQFARVSSDLGASCALDENGSAVCWGTNVPTDIPGTFSELSGGAKPCGIRPDGSAECFGWSPDQPPPTQKIARLSVRGGHACAIRAASN